MRQPNGNRGAAFQHAVGDYPACLRLPRWQHAWRRDALRDPLMRPRLIEVGAVFLQDANRLEPADHQHVIQTFPPQTPHKPFADGIGTWRLVRRVDDFDTGDLGHPLKYRTILLVIVADQLFRLLPKRPLERVDLAGAVVADAAPQSLGAVMPGNILDLPLGCVGQRRLGGEATPKGPTLASQREF